MTTASHWAVSTDIRLADGAHPTLTATLGQHAKITATVEPATGAVVITITPTIRTPLRITTAGTVIHDDTQPPDPHREQDPAELHRTIDALRTELTATRLIARYVAHYGLSCCDRDTAACDDTAARRAMVWAGATPEQIAAIETATTAT
jgi:hypothetical protein